MKEDKTVGALQLGSAEEAWTGNASYRILFAEDDDGIRLMMSTMLVRSGYQVDAVRDGEEAWQALNSELYDLIITDNNMPRLTGIDVLKRMRAARMSIPVIMASGNLPQTEFNLSPWLRPEAVLSKPYTLSGLLSSMAEILHAGCSHESGTAPTVPVAPPSKDQVRV